VAATLGALIGFGVVSTIVPGWRVTSFVAGGSWGLMAHGDLISDLISLMAPLLLIASLCIVAGALMAPLLLIASLCIVAGARHAPNSRRRNAAALPKIRIPSTTMIAVDNCVPTPN